MLKEKTPEWNGKRSKAYSKGEPEGKRSVKERTTRERNLRKRYSSPKKKGEHVKEKIPWEGEFTLRSDP